LEQLNTEGLIDVYYGDETHICSQGYVPYGWQFPGEDVCILSDRSYKFNCLGLINRQNHCRWTVTEDTVNTDFVLSFLEQFSFEINKETFVVLDNARIHKTKAIKERIPYWQQRELFLFFLPPYCPHLNIAETLWRKLKKEWIDPHHYLTKDILAYTLNRCMNSIGTELNIKFSKFNKN
jgi:transposase